MAVDVGCTIPVSSVNNERRKRVFIGDLPDDFLRLAPSANRQEDTDQQAAIALHRQLNSPVCQNVMGRLNITVDKAKLVKNYGFTRMDPYVRLRVGHCVYETHTDTNGGKFPRWNKVIQCLIAPGVKFINIEIYDERSFTMDELIAWAQIAIPASVFRGEIHEEWFPLSGKQGEGQEGVINLVLSYTPGPLPAPPAGPPVMVVPKTGTSLFGLRNYAAVPVYTDPTPACVVNSGNTSSSSVDLKQIEEMFPNVDKEVIKSVNEQHAGDKDAVINALLQMSP